MPETIALPPPAVETTLSVEASATPAPAPSPVPAPSTAAVPAALSFGHVLARLDSSASGLTLCTGPFASSMALPFCAPFLLREQTVVAVDGANCFNLYRLTEWARRRHIDPLALLRRLRIARAFTPFQLATILHHIGREMRQHRAALLVITGLPDCLYDEELDDQEARNTFARCRQSLALLREQHNVLAFADSSSRAVSPRHRFLAALAADARTVLETRPGEPAAFALLQAPGLSAPALPTPHKGEDSYGQNPADRQPGAGAEPGAVDPFLPGLAP